MIYKKIISVLMLFTILNAGCPPCQCSDGGSYKGKVALIASHTSILLKNIIPNLSSLLKETKKLKKMEEENLELTRQLVAYEYYKTLKMKSILRSLKKVKSFLFLKIKAIQNFSKQENIKNKMYLYEIKSNK